jgi:hypothetical protein
MLQSVAAVLTFGEQKYAAHNWRKGIDQSRLIDAALRHINDYNAGKMVDDETQLPILAHAICELMFAMNLVVTKPEFDDRFKGL